MHNCILKAQNNIHYWKQISEENISYQSRPIAMHQSHYSKGSSTRIWIVYNHTSQPNSGLSDLNPPDADVANCVTVQDCDCTQP